MERSANRANESSNASSRRLTGRSASGTQFRRPSRQPHDPPQGVFAQSDSGFERFVKEYSSPKHQRVTAGGRIVPMKQLTPPPKMRLPVNQEGTTTGIQSRDEPQLLQETAARPMGQDQNTSNFPSSSLHSAVLTDYASFIGVNGSLGPQLQVPGLFANVPHGSITPAMILQPQLSLQPGTQHIFQPEHQSTDNLPVFPNYAAHGIEGDQVTLLQNVNGTSNYPTAIIPFLACQKNPSTSRDSSEFSTGSNLNGLVSVYNSMPKGSDPFYNPIGPSAQRVPTPQASANSQTLPPSNITKGVSPLQTLQNVIKEYTSLSVQLSRLDRYTAVHTWDMDPRQKRITVEQRMSLVRELDVIRTYKEQLEALCEQLKSTNSENTQTSSAPRASERPARHGSSIPIRASRTTVPQETPTLPPEKPAKLSSTSRSTGQQSKPVQQRQKTGKGRVFNDGHGSTSMSSNREAHPRNKAPLRDQSLNREPNPNDHSGRGIISDRRETVGTSESSDELVTIPQPASSDVRKLYRDIDEAIKRGSPIDGFLQELAATTTRFSSRCSNNSGTTLRLSSKKESHISGDTTGSTSGATCSMPYAVDDNLRSARLAARRPWASEDQSRPPAEVVPDETDYDDDGGSWSSYDSTEDSWDTVQEGE